MYELTTNMIVLFVIVKEYTIGGPIQTVAVIKVTCEFHCRQNHTSVFRIEIIVVGLNRIYSFMMISQNIFKHIAAKNPSVIVGRWHL